jgi:long-chain acyl-CoA synthetase
MALAYVARRRFLGNMNLTELLDKAASDWPKKMALIEGDNAVSYNDLVENTVVLATQLQALKLPPACRVGLCLPNSVNYVALTFALWRIDAIVVPIPMECTEDEMSNIATTMELDAILSQKPRGPSVSLRPNVFFTRLTPTLPSVHHGLNLAFIRFTSGTTNARKGVALCHQTINDRIMAANQALRIGPNDTVMWCLPMSHHFLVTILLYLSQGATIVLARHVLSRPFLEAAYRRQGTVLYAAPFHYSMLARDSSGMKLHSIRLAVSTTCSLPEEVAVGFQERFGLPLSQALGIIELGLVCVNMDDPVMRWNSVGRPLSKYAVNIRDADSNGYGEVLVSGPGFFDAYINPWISRDQLMPDGWFATGDIGRMDAQGYLFLAGRIKELINRGGEKIWPREIDEALMAHPAVEEALAFAIPDSRLGEEIGAAVVLKNGMKATPEEIQEFGLGRLADFKVPRRVVIVPEIPKGPTGKPQRIGLAAQLGVQEHAPAAPQRAAFAAPRNEIERTMARFWREVLGIQEAGRNDRFLESGGDSISATRLIARMNEEFGCQISVLAFFQSPTIASLAELVAKKQGEAITSRNLDEVLDELEGLSEVEAELLLSEPDRPAPENREQENL